MSAGPGEPAATACRQWIHQCHLPILSHPDVVTGASSRGRAVPPSGLRLKRVPRKQPDMATGSKFA